MLGPRIGMHVIWSGVNGKCGPCDDGHYDLIGNVQQVFIVRHYVLAKLTGLVNSVDRKRGIGQRLLTYANIYTGTRCNPRV